MYVLLYAKVYNFIRTRTLHNTKNATNGRFYFVFKIKRANFALVIGLERHIEILLLSNDCVIVPGLGGFIASHVPARYDDGDSLFLPPLRTLGFNSKLTLNDSLLVQSYSEYYDISYPEALTRIESESNELMQHIKNSGSYELNDIGTLYLNEDGNIEFTPCEAGILTPELYSLSSFEMQKKSAFGANTNENTTKRNSKRNDIKDAQAAKDKQEKAKTEDADAQIETQNERTIKIKLSWLRNVAATFIAIIMFFAISNPVNNSDKPLKMGSIDNGVISQLMTNGSKNTAAKTTESVKKAQEKPINTVESVAEVKAEEAKATTVEAQEQAEVERDYYCIVLASQVAKANAEAFATMLIKKGYGETKVLNETKRSTKVVFGHYKTQSEAYNKLNDLRDSEYFTEAWVYQVKK